MATSESQGGLTENHAKDLEALRLGAINKTRRTFSVGCEDEQLQRVKYGGAEPE